ncbi:MULTISPECIES: FtsB family cell division protein [unclassified Arthrobacter]|uniref:FtsB family cell division protein n=1 Tax=unclassified Arthrobacter TaxID=235627 RepID=UPI001DD95163|nr:septum formation initiator family protein [Arthrobacter sp. Bi26]CAH0167898.1 Cell division protein FtsL [Arthrobacter sp. Bi26]
MATRRPNVPRATPAAAKPAGTGLGAADDGGEVIQADFGGSRSAAPTPAAPSGASPASPRAAAPAAGKAAANGSGAAAPAAGKRRPAAAPGTTPAASAAKPATRPAPGKAGGKATGRTAAGGADESLDPVPAKAFSGRLLALGVVMIAITILLAPTVKIFLDKRAEIAALQADIAAKQTKQEDLKRQVSRWQDPNYVKQQARDRINMVMPGETGYWVFGSDLPAAQSSGTAGAASAQDPANLPWVDSLWESIRRSATD